MNRTSTLFALVLTLAGMFAVACSSGDSAATKSGGVATAAATTSGGTSATKAATAAATSGGTTASGSVCDKIPLADMQALTPQPLGEVTDTNGGQTTSAECQFAGTEIRVRYNLNDADKTSYNNLAGTTDHQLSGVGDEAYWNEALAGNSPPYLVAHKGVVTCVIGSEAPPDTTMKTTLNGAPFTVTDEDALAYVNLMGKVCNDIFAAT